MANRILMAGLLIVTLTSLGTEDTLPANEATKRCNELSSTVCELAHKVYPLYEECRADYRDLCKQVLAQLLNDLAAKNMHPDKTPLLFELSGPLTEVASYKINVTYSLETPSIIAMTRFECKKSKTAYFKWILTPVIDVTLPLQQPSPDLCHPYLDPDGLYAILAHELGHVWHFDLIKRLKFISGALAGMLGGVVALNHTLQHYLVHKALQYGHIRLKDQSMALVALEIGAISLGVAFNKLVGAFIRHQEYAADQFISQAAPTTAAHKQAIAFMARFHIITELEQTVIACFYDNTALRLRAKAQALSRPHTHPYPRERIVRFITEWRALQTNELVAEGRTQEEAKQLAHEQVAQEYTQMITDMREFDATNFGATIKATYKWEPDTEEKKALLLQKLESTQQSLLNLVR